MSKGPARQSLIILLPLLAIEPANAGMVTTQDWWGSIGYTHQRRMLNNETTETRNQLTGDLNGNYYLWQPWFLTGKLRVTVTEDSTDGSTSRDSHALGGSISANILPLSRYPMSLGYSKSDNTINDSANFINSTGQLVSLGDTVSSTSYFLTQQYLGKRFKLSASYHADENESEVTGTFSSIRRKLEFVRRDPHNDLNVNWQQQQDQHSNTDEGRQNEMAVLTHNFYPTQDFTVANFASTIDQSDRIDLNADGIADDYHNVIDQVSSTTTWRSSDKKTHLNANLRYTGIQTDQQAASYENLTSNIGVGARYSFSNNLNTSVAASHTTMDLNNVASEQELYAAAVNYTSDNIDLAGYGYNWGSSLDHTQQVTDGASDTTSSLSLNHGVSRNWLHGRKGQIRFGANQGYNNKINNTQQNLETLTHSLRIGYASGGDGSTHYSQASYTESHGINGSEEMSQQLNLQYSQMHRLSQRSSLDGSVSHQESIYRSADQDISSASSSALLNYSFRQSFSFQTVSFNSSLRYSVLHSNTAEDSNSYSWDNILKHQIGQVASNLTIRIQNQQDQRETLILFNVKRQF